MAEDPYKTLGVAKSATADEIRAAYRKLAKKHHPDLNPGDKAAEERFKQISSANEFLNDPESRAKYDAGEIDADGAPMAPPRAYRQYAEGEPGARYAYAGGAGAAGGAEGFEDIFSTIFSGGRPRSTGPVRGADEHYSLTAAFLDAVTGATRRLTLPDGQTLDVKIPPGTAEGQILRLRGRGAAGQNHGQAGDALIEVHIAPHGFFGRDGQNITLDLPMTVKEAAIGAKIPVPTPTGTVEMTVKPHTETGTRLRLRGRGVPATGALPAGDLYVTLRIHIGPPDNALDEFLAAWTPAVAHDPRAGMLEGAKP